MNETKLEQAAAAARDWQRWNRHRKNDDGTTREWPQENMDRAVVRLRDLCRYKRVRNALAETVAELALAGVEL